MRIIPGNTKVQIEIFKGVTLADMLVAAIGLLVEVLVITSSLPHIWITAGIMLFVWVILLARIDKEPNYQLLINMLRHFAYRRRFERDYSDSELKDIAKRGEREVFFDNIFNNEGEEAVQEYAEEELFPEEDEEDEAGEEEPHEETKEERKARLKAEKEERKADDRLLKSKTLSKEEEDAIWLKRARQSEARKQAKRDAKEEKKYGAKSVIKSEKAALKKGKEATEKLGRSAGRAVEKRRAATQEDVSNIMAFTGIKGGFIEYGNSYYGVAIEIPPVEFRFFSEHRRNNSIEAGLGSILRAIRPDYCVNIVKIERPVIYDSYRDNEYKKLDELRKSFESGFITEEELKSRVAIVYDRINELIELSSESRIVVPFYYVVLFDSDKQQLTNMVNNALDSLRAGEMSPKRLNDKETAVFLRYTNEIDFDEREIDKIRPEDYAVWAMPHRVLVTPRTVRVNGMVTHNMRTYAYPSAVGDAWLASLMTYPSTKVVVKAKPMDRTKSISAIDHSLSELRAKFNSAHTDSEAMEARAHIQSLQSLLGMLQGDNETLLEMNIYVTSYDLSYTMESPKIPDIKYSSIRARITNMKRAVKRVYNEYGIKLNNMEFCQHRAFIGGQVSGYDPMAGKGRGLPSNSIAGCFPWVFSHVMDNNGVKLGYADGVPVFVDFFRRDSERVNSNMVIMGKSGSGKSYATKSLLSNLAADDSKIFILDPENEYAELAKNLNGKYINVANSKYGRLNPFHIITALDDDDEENDNSSNSSYATHLQFLEEFFRQILPDCDKDSLEYLNSLVDRVYANHNIDGYTNLSLLRPEDYPTFDDLFDEILKEFQRTDNEYLRTMLRTLMNYVSKFSTGGRNSDIWNGPSSITTEENFTVFNFQSLLSNRNTTVANAQMLLVLKYIDNEIIKNRDYNTKYGLNRKVVVVIDEAHVFIDTKFPVALDFMFQLAKRIRKYNGMQIVISQNIKDFVGSEEIARKSTAIINACQYSFIFSLAPNDMNDLCKLYEKAGGINETEQEQIIQARRGQAFTILSPNSRAGFRITVPDDIRDLFSDPNYRNAYFTGLNGDKNWSDFIGNSAEVREANLAEREARLAAEAENKENEQKDKSHVVFIETSDEELMKEQEEARKSQAEKKAASYKHVSFEALEDLEIPDLPEDPEAFRTMMNNDIPKQTVQQPAVVPQIIQQTSVGGGKTDEMLAQLISMLGKEAMSDTIRRTVREELGSTASQIPAAAAAEASVSPASDTSSEDADSILGSLFDFSSLETDSDMDSYEEEDVEDTTSDNILGNIFDFAEADETQKSGAPQAGNETDYSASGFDVMSLLAQAAENVAEEDSPIEKLLTGEESVAEVTLEQLMHYTAAR